MRGLLAVFLIAVGICCVFAGADAKETIIPDVQVRLNADEKGALTQVMLGRRNLGNDALAFERLNNEILKEIGKPGNPLTHDLVVVIEVGADVKFEDVAKAVSACMGRKDSEGKFVRYVTNLRILRPGEE